MQIKSNHSFVGWANAFNVMGEMRSNDPARTVRKASRISLLLITVLYLFINVAYVAAIPADEIRSSGQLVAVLFFQRIFGTKGATAFPLLVSLSCFGNIVRQYKHSSFFFTNYSVCLSDCCGNLPSALQYSLIDFSFLIHLEPGPGECCL